jgi:hypothetical protein
VYANLASEEKRVIIEGMKERGEVVDVVGGTEVVGEKGFEPIEILLVRTGGPPKEWEVLARVPL